MNLDILSENDTKNSLNKNSEKPFASTAFVDMIVLAVVQMLPQHYLLVCW